MHALLIGAGVALSVLFLAFGAPIFGTLGGAAPVWALFALVGASMAAFGLSVAAAVYFTPWGR